ncbi:MAG: peptidylprolyl isomerase [Actinobacteria bacterium]|nr:peptidylprolyl isomerase [Actinomycetota bacterium]
MKLFRVLPALLGFVVLTACSSGSTPDPAASTSSTDATAPAVETSALPTEATIKTSMGDIDVKLLPEAAPMTVANFVGLATGTKEWTDPATGNTTSEPLYNDTVFHRVIPDFMIQGGDPLGNGTGGPGYEFEDEIDTEHDFSKPYVVAMANSGPDTNGSQFFITVAPTPWLNGMHSIFGEVSDKDSQQVVLDISKVKTNAADEPIKPVVIKTISVKE